MITQNDIKDLINAANCAGFQINAVQRNLELEQWDAGLKTHSPNPLPLGMAAVYIFKYQDIYLKVGKANSNSNARYQSQHYNPFSSGSNLSKSLLCDSVFMPIIGSSDKVGDWIKKNTTRFNIIIPQDMGKNFVNFVEAFFILKCNPKFEG